MAWWIVPAAIGGLKALTTVGQFVAGRKNRTPRANETEYGQYLKKVGDEGRFSAGVRSQMLGRVSGEAGNLAHTETMRREGTLAARGMEGSVAGQAYTRAPQLERGRIVGRAARDLEVENELSKDQARSAYGRLALDLRMKRTQENREDYGQLFGGVADAATSGYGAWLAERAAAARGAGGGGDDRAASLRQPATVTDALMTAGVHPEVFVAPHGMTEWQMQALAQRMGISLEELRRLQVQMRLQDLQ